MPKYSKALILNFNLLKSMNNKNERVQVQIKLIKIDSKYLVEIFNSGIPYIKLINNKGINKTTAVVLLIKTSLLL